MLNIEEIKEALSDVLEPLFKQQVVKIEKAANEVERKALFVVLAPDEVDAHGDTYSAKEIEKGMQSFNRHCMKANIFHMIETQEAEIVQSYTIPVDMYIGDEFIKKGTWIQEWFFPETEVGEQLWQGVLNKEITGVSVGCLASVEELDV